MEVELTQEIVTENVVSVTENLTHQQANTNDTEYELDQSESLTFLYNLLYDDQSYLSKSDILSILNSLKLREEKLPFSFVENSSNDNQGVSWPPGLRTKFLRDRKRIGSKNWFHNITNSLELSKKSINIKRFDSLTEFYKFDKFYSKLKLHITHFQLRNLVCCSDFGKGIFYPSSYDHDFNLQTVNYESSNESVYSFFKINRLLNSKNDAKLDCIIDSRSLLKNSNSRISTLACSKNYLVSGTFEGDYILNKIDYDDSELIGEYNLTNNYDGITNSIIIKEEENQLIISSNDKFIRYIDLSNNSKQQIELPFAVNCLALNHQNPNEYFISGDDINSYIIDQRIPFDLSNIPRYNGQEDYSFSCDWSPSNENWLLSGNQDGCVRIWDKRWQDPLYTWSGSLGSKEFDGNNNSGPVRNTKFSRTGEFICWAESLDHIGIMNVNDFNNDKVDRIQSIEFIGKCTGANFVYDGYNENLIVGVNDCPLGGILSYNLESRDKCLDFDLSF